MKMRRIRSKTNNGVAVVKKTAISMAIIGFLMCQPFFWLVILNDTYEPHISLNKILWLVLMIMGLPTMFFGLISLVSKSSTQSSTLEIEVSRIRHMVETDKTIRR